MFSLHLIQCLFLYIFLLQTLHLLSDIATSYSCSAMLLNLACQHSILSSRLLHFCSLYQTKYCCYMPPATSSGTATTAWLSHLICRLHHAHQYTHTGVHHTGITMPSWSNRCGGAGTGKPAEGGLFCWLALLFTSVVFGAVFCQRTVRIAFS